MLLQFLLRAVALHSFGGQLILGISPATEIIIVLLNLQDLREALIEEKH